MKYYIDCEFDNQLGKPCLLSMALMREDGHSIYIVLEYAHYGVIHDQWVQENVIPILYDVPVVLGAAVYDRVPRSHLPSLLEGFFKGDPAPHIVADWPIDIRLLCDALVTGPGTMIDIPGILFEVKRVDVYPTKNKHAVQHNAWWDAHTLWKALK